MVYKNKTVMRMRIFSIPLLAILFFIAFTYKDLFKVFLQQDEWRGLGIVLGGGVFGIFNGISVVHLLSGQNRFFGSLLNSIFFSLFHFNIVPFALFAIGIHMINTVLWFYVSYSVTKHRIVSYISCCFFALSFVASQSITWFASIFTTLPSATCIFISLLFIQKYIKEKLFKYLIFAQCAAIFAYIFKESSAFIFLLLPFVVWKSESKFYMPVFLKRFSFLLAYGIFVMIVRIYSVMGLGPAAGMFVSRSSFIWIKMLIHTFLYPVVSFSQMFIPQQLLFKIGALFQKIYFGNLIDPVMSKWVAETIVSEYVSFIIAVIAIGVLICIAYRVKTIRNWVIFASVFFIGSFLPFVVLDKGSAYLDSRYFYLGTAGGGLLIGSLLYGILFFLKKKSRIVGIIAGICMGISFFLYIYKNSIYIQRDVKELSIISQERMFILHKIKEIIPVLPDKPIIFVTGNHYGYYSNPEVKIPFQQGFGYTLMTWYSDTGAIPKEFLTEGFLWEIKEQGYKELSGKGFGYFFDKIFFQEYISKHAVRKEQIVAFFYDYEKKEIRDITEEIGVQYKELFEK